MRTRTEWLKGFGIYVATLTLPGMVLAQTGAGHPEDMPEPPMIYSPYVARTAADTNLAEGVYWGDTHVHTSYSTDAGMFGSSLGPDDHNNRPVQAQGDRTLYLDKNPTVPID